MIATSNRFYAEFDLACFSDAVNGPRAGDHRGIFAQERDRIVFSNSFRRLQAKTQVFQAGEYDFYRTRLTHSLEVATIAKSILTHLICQETMFGPGFHPDFDLIEAVCLAHDIGHPPFGHAGERALHALMEPYGGFEGNAQSLRILTRTIYPTEDGRGGMSPSRALIDGILKYKRLFRARGGDTHHFIYEDQRPILDFCFGSAGALRKDRREPNGFRSIECQIMDAADDIAYSTCDIVDGARARFITTDKLRRWLSRNASRLSPPQAARIERVAQRLGEGFLNASMSKAIGEFIGACRLVPVTNFMTPKTRRYAFNLAIEPEQLDQIKVLKEIGRTMIYGAPELQQIEYKGSHLLRRLVDAFSDVYLTRGVPRLKLLPIELHERVAGTAKRADRARLLCDHISGMTDAYAIRTYKRLSDPDYSPISEL